MEKICAVNAKEKEHDTAYHFTWNNQYNRLFNKKDTGRCIDSNGNCGYHKLFYAQQSIISVAVALIPRNSAYGSSVSYKGADRIWRCCCCDFDGIVCDC